MPRLRSQSSCSTADTMTTTSSSMPDLEDGAKDSSGKNKTLRHGGWRRWHVRTSFVWGVWAVVFAWGELGAGMYAMHSCDWAYGDRKEYHLAVIADPQLTDFYSYDMVKGSWVLWLTEFYSDLYMRRHFSLLARKANPPHGVMLLGDLFDGGMYIHQVIPSAHVVPHVDVVDAIGLLSNDDAVRADAMTFVQTYGSMKAKRQFPRLLFSHIPLFRPPHSPCGPRRQKAPIAPGRGVSYENVLSPELTAMILDAVEPIHISGDDHTPCTYHHEAFNVTEDSLATFSWLQGERHPELSMLSLQGSPYTSPSMHIHTCALPDQMGIYLGYACLGVVSVVYLALGRHAHVPSQKRSVAFSCAVIVAPILAWYCVLLMLSLL
ncbi:hypothetical protein DYB25_003720 [Aphanomyces astaci]|uniref:Calcineurin-like phosphoesterase domain-containing protein n=1 Tax=Aphanomyces astaci TaxID=112090 RepID=A0A397AP33_APHAT|nr:hypothetical protein DYB25_003720 [Aphanomyces astaci]RHY52778.1 hypothetical protein DYB38_002580 [Aphanomyces astaci]RHY57728.1 hypothetical protein DYB30_004900 [Aphanomyces astaci]